MVDSSRAVVAIIVGFVWDEHPAAATAIARTDHHDRPKMAGRMTAVDACTELTHSSPCYRAPRDRRHLLF
jgi:hypothetical protein